MYKFCTTAHIPGLGCPPEKLPDGDNSFPVKLSDGDNSLPEKLPDGDNSPTDECEVLASDNDSANECEFNDTDEQVRHIMVSRPVVNPADQTSADKKCKWGHENCPCSTTFSHQSIESCRDSCAELSHNELDITIMAQLKSRTDKWNRTNFFHNGIRICKSTFLFLHGMSKKKFHNIKKSFGEHGLQPRVHGNTKRIPHHALSFDVTQSVLKFLIEYAEQNAIVLPGRVPGYSRTYIKLLQSSMSKRSIRKMLKASADSNLHLIGYSTFCRLWRNLLPSILVMKPMTDLCWTFQKNNSSIIMSVNCSEQDKTEVLKRAEEHLRVVHVERSNYNTKLAECSLSIQEHYSIQPSSFEPPPPSSFVKSKSKHIILFTMRNRCFFPRIRCSLDRFIF